MTDTPGGDDVPPVPPEEEEPESPWSQVAREVAISVGVVLLIAAILFAASGVWPPLVAVESDSMEPQIMTGDLVFIVEADRFPSDDAIEGTGVVPADRGEEVGHEKFDRPGDVIIFAPNGNGEATPIIHRAQFWVEAEEDWFDRADPELIGSADDCDQLSSCPAPHGGFITHGDNNRFYDQIQEESAPVRSEWIVARASFRVPLVGHLRLVLADLLAFVAPVSA